MHIKDPRPPKNVAEAAQYLGVSIHYLNKLRCFGGGPAFIKFGSRVLYEVEDLDHYKASHKRRSTSEAA
jgi:hypothetical protein